MPKINMPKSSPSLDMTPMVDLAFLLVTFFMLTASVRVDEPVIVDMPATISEKILPKNTMMVTVDKDCRLFFNMDNGAIRIQALEEMGNIYKVTFTDKEKNVFAKLGSFGVPIKNLPAYLDMDDIARSKYKSQGIPVDTTANNEIGDWLRVGYNKAGGKYNTDRRKAKDNGAEYKGEPPRLSIKADGKTNYLCVQQVINVIKKKDLEPRINFITNLEDEPK